MGFTLWDDREAGAFWGVYFFSLSVTLGVCVSFSLSLFLYRNIQNMKHSVICFVTTLAHNLISEDDLMIIKRHDASAIYGRLCHNTLYLSTLSDSLFAGEILPNGLQRLVDYVFNPKHAFLPHSNDGVPQNLFL